MSRGKRGRAGGKDPKAELGHQTSDMQPALHAKELLRAASAAMRPRRGHNNIIQALLGARLTTEPWASSPSPLGVKATPGRPCCPLGRFAQKRGEL